MTTHDVYGRPVADHVERMRLDQEQRDRKAAEHEASRGPITPFVEPPKRAPSLVEIDGVSRWVEGDELEEHRARRAHEAAVLRGEEPAHDAARSYTLVTGPFKGKAARLDAATARALILAGVVDVGELDRP